MINTEKSKPAGSLSIMAIPTIHTSAMQQQTAETNAHIMSSNLFGIKKAEWVTTQLAMVMCRFINIVHLITVVLILKISWRKKQQANNSS